LNNINPTLYKFKNNGSTAAPLEGGAAVEPLLFNLYKVGLILFKQKLGP